ncbi:CGNR zinc finger domain-containing protein [Scleromatobacter humisilvae]|uniref:CGNR zinc finger domain-containing protein n=1 Tax=Scleromatobacter humisilvae TaxID=2897159 RepID=A0A9X1YJU6_9BURK|nr:CGNR zinc finger domain-containing protein [Scleromatobacter humisilvae]MCK9687012.1 CGNR zinc finger domain-containing protein [Scleromatobacter humisilvae]
MTADRPPAMFLAEAAGLDFLNTLAIPVDVEVEWLGSGEDLLAWLEAAGLLDQAALDEVRALATAEELDAVAAQARALREWLRGFVQRHRGKPLTRSAEGELEPLNGLLARDRTFTQIVARPRAELRDGDSALEVVARRRWQSADDLLLPIAQAIAELVSRADFAEVKKCEGPTCVLHFLDTTRGGRRRWCNMAVCGNRAKQAAHRDRAAAR